MASTQQAEEWLAILELVKLYHEKWNSPFIFASFVGDVIQICALPECAKLSISRDVTSACTMFCATTSVTLKEKNVQVTPASEELTEDRSAEKDYVQNTDSSLLQTFFSASDDPVEKQIIHKQTLTDKTSRSKAVFSTKSKTSKPFGGEHEWQYSHRASIQEQADVSELQLHQSDIQCSFCFTTFKTRHLLSLHHRSCPGVGEAHSSHKIFDIEESYKLADQPSQNSADQPSQNSADQPSQNSTLICYPCNSCDEYFSSQGELSKHNKVCLGVPVYTCSECEQTFTHTKKLIKHLVDEHETKRHQCQFCPKSFKRNSFKLKHEARVHGCEYKLETPAEAEKIASGEQYKCSQCLDLFETEDDLDLHLQELGHKMNCPFCFHDFSSFFQLVAHQSERKCVHRFQCKYCYTVFTKLVRLNRHLRTHTGEKPYMCELCSRRFSDLSSLKTHTRVHSNEKIFPCKKCNKRFKHMQNLRDHENIHNGFKRYACTYCDKKFAWYTLLKNHQEAHLGIKYFCSFCPKSFQTKSGLTKHMRISHANTPYQPPSTVT